MLFRRLSSTSLVAQRTDQVLEFVWRNSDEFLFQDPLMTHQPSTDSELLDQETVSFWTRVRRGVLLIVIAVVMYLLLTGPLLWHRRQGPTWR